MAVGRNTLDIWYNNINLNGTTGYALGAMTSTNYDVEYEALLLSGDSGAPMMVEVIEGSNAKLKLVGINWFNSPSTNPHTSGFSYVGNYSSEIKNFISANPVPELSATGIYMALFLMTFGLGSRRISLKSNWLQS